MARCRRSCPWLWDLTSFFTDYFHREEEKGAHSQNYTLSSTSFPSYSTITSSSSSPSYSYYYPSLPFLLLLLCPYFFFPFLSPNPVVQTIQMYVLAQKILMGYVVLTNKRFNAKRTSREEETNRHERFKRREKKESIYIYIKLSIIEEVRTFIFTYITGMDRKE